MAVVQSEAEKGGGAGGEELSQGRGADLAVVTHPREVEVIEELGLF